jgi:predicted N-acetyltransferase YhbS
VPRDAFQASLDDPFYEPADRLIARVGAQIVGHLHVLKRVMHFAGIEIPMAGLTGLAVPMEERIPGMAGGLMAAAQQAMIDDGAMLAVLRTRAPRFFVDHGWAVCGRHCHSRAATRDVLAQLSARGIPPADGPVRIRPWRQVELPGLMRLYSERMATAIGPFARTEAYWRWRISRQEFDQIFVALDGPDHLDWATLDSPIAGYVITRGDRIVELLARPLTSAGSAGDADYVAEQLVARACGEAIERDDHAVQLHAAPDDRLHRLFAQASGRYTHREDHQGDFYMAKLLDPAGLVRRLGETLCARAVEAGLPRTLGLGLCIDGQRHRLSIARRGARLKTGHVGRSYLKLRRSEFTRLLLGHLDLTEAVAQQRVEASTRLALETAAILFPRLPYWRPPWDDVVC